MINRIIDSKHLMSLQVVMVTLIQYIPYFNPYIPTTLIISITIPQSIILILNLILYLKSNKYILYLWLTDIVTLLVIIYIYIMCIASSYPPNSTSIYDVVLLNDGPVDIV